MRRALLLGLLTTVGLMAGHAHAPRSQALFHLAVIDEVMTSYGGDANVQFVEIRMLFGSQNMVANSVLGAFNASGGYLGDVLIVPSNVTSSGAGVRWIMGTSAFATAVSPMTPDFTMPASLPTTGGMVCWGAPGILPPAPGSWDHTVPANYVDCLAYGTYSGPTNIHIGTPTSLNAIGHSLRRVTETNNNANDFVCADPATPTRNNGTSASMAATTLCGTDSDGDNYSDLKEVFMGTDPLDACADDMMANNERGPAFLEPLSPQPPDFNDDKSINILDIVQLTPPTFNTAPPNINYSQRKDLDASGAINILDIVQLTPPNFNTSCV